MVDRFVVYIVADVDLARGRGKCAADRQDEGARISEKVLYGRWNYDGFALRWGRSESNAFGDVVEHASFGVGRGLGRGVSHAITYSSLATTCHGRPGSWAVEEPIKPFIGHC